LTLLNKIRKDLTAKDNTGDVDFSFFDFAKFESSMRKIDGSKCSLSDYIYKVHEAYYSVSGNNNYKGFVAKEGNWGLVYLGKMMKDFPDVKFVVMVRDPRDVFSSAKEISNTHVTHFIFNTGGNAGHRMLDFSNKLYSYLNSSNFLFVRYEDLVINTKDVMSLVSNFLGVEFNSSMLIATTFGSLWRGNSSNRDLNFSTISASRVGRWKKDLDDFEIYAIEYFFKDYMKLWGYKFASKVNVKIDSSNRVILEQLIETNREV